jgi:hypothetical protein
MVFNTTHVPDDCPDLDTAMRRYAYASFGLDTTMEKNVIVVVRIE